MEAEGRPNDGTRLIVTTNRHTLAELKAGSLYDRLRELGVDILTDVCSYNTKVLPRGVQRAMTNSAKWAHYGEGNHGISVVLGSLRECVKSAVLGKVWRDDYL